MVFVKHSLPFQNYWHGKTQTRWSINTLSLITQQWLLCTPRASRVHQHRAPYATHALVSHPIFTWTWSFDDTQTHKSANTHTQAKQTLKKYISLATGNTDQGNEQPDECNETGKQRLYKHMTQLWQVFIFTIIRWLASWENIGVNLIVELFCPTFSVSKINSERLIIQFQLYNCFWTTRRKISLISMKVWKHTYQIANEISALWPRLKCNGNIRMCLNKRSLGTESS